MKVSPSDLDPRERTARARGGRVKGCPPPDVILPALAGDVLSPRFTEAVRMHLDRCGFCSTLAPELHAGADVVTSRDAAGVYARVASRTGRTGD